MPRFILAHDEARRRAKLAIDDAPAGHVVTISPAKRSLDQNAALWPVLDALAKGVVWHGHRLTDEEWKDVLTAGLKAQKVVPGIDGGFVVIGAHTSKMNKAEFSELLDLAHAFAAQEGIEIDYQSTSGTPE